MGSLQKITPCLWFDDQAEAAAAFYVSIFRDSRIVRVIRYGEVGQEVHGKPPGTAMSVAFELEGQPFTALNGGPIYKFTEAVSLEVHCETQEDVDHYWRRLSDGGDPAAQQCGWLKDKYGLSWQIVPTALHRMLADPDHRRAQRVTEALLKMKRLDLNELEKAYGG